LLARLLISRLPANQARAICAGVAAFRAAVLIEKIDPIDLQPPE